MTLKNLIFLSVEVGVMIFRKEEIMSYPNPWSRKIAHPVLYVFYINTGGGIDGSIGVWIGQWMWGLVDGEVCKLAGILIYGCIYGWGMMCR